MNSAKLQELLLTHFQWFHRHPELGNTERQTTARIREILAAAGVEILDTGLSTGLVAIVRGKGGPVVALRADIDALPVTEASGLDYASENIGCMHACGHDFHLTALLGAALLLQEQKDALDGSVKLIFQPAEELIGGARQVLDSGALDDVREIYGLHVASEVPAGTIAVSAGATHAAVGGFQITVRGKGGHAAAPHECVDPIVAAAQLVGAAQTIVSRNTDPFDKAVLSVTSVHSGNTWNVIPPDARLEGTIRALGTEQYKSIAGRFGQLCRGVALATGTEIDYTWHLGAPATNNDPALTRFAAETAEGLKLTVVPDVPGMGGEDFALYQERIPGVFWRIGVGSPQAVHHPAFVADPAPLHTAATLLAALGKAALKRLVK
ncbi:amidohydrolase [Sporobacter termitidis DSM 10068]|uniref:Amidohydrolase n=1 Tax=Sporobacter termitidis DSM 10068 TaxID=1123282 RepID=A0A1M5ZE18_9FIRM|nr:amidohydrolase [Sporobacter termitidis]SHI22253.1 amidohydrolase [Sporobacter termitidis DSM 10068]